MRIIFFIIILSVLSIKLFSQNEFNNEYEKLNSITIGIFQGGGSYIGADFELLVSQKIGIQIGAGFIGFGGGLNYHFKPSIRSSFLSLQYWNQDIIDSFIRSAISCNYVFRGKKWFTFQIGLSYPLEKEEQTTSNNYEQTITITPSIAIGAYIPI